MAYVDQEPSPALASYVTAVFADACVRFHNARRESNAEAAGLWLDLTENLEAAYPTVIQKIVAQAHAQPDTIGAPANE